MPSIVLRIVYRGLHVQVNMEDAYIIYVYV
jgi:hypothetical protein